MIPGTDIEKMLQENSRRITDSAGRDLRGLEDEKSMKIADEFHRSLRYVYAEALRVGIYPYRYLRNREIISPEEQLKLAESRVAVIGAGGLGGQVIILLARIGVGQLVVADNDLFEEINLNRQALCSEVTLGMPKSDVAVDVVTSINPGVEVTAYQVKTDSTNIPEIINDSDVVVDALDNIPDRFVLEEASKNMGIPMVHGALAGFEGQIMTVFPEDKGLKLLYENERVEQNNTKTPEAILGIPAMTPSVVATFQAMEVLKIILKRGKIFRNMMVYIDLETGELNEFFFKNYDQ